MLYLIVNFVTFGEKLDVVESIWGLTKSSLFRPLPAPLNLYALKLLADLSWFAKNYRRPTEINRHLVHSLVTMISLKMEIPADAWEDDPNGITFANCVNSSLPKNIRVFRILLSKKLLYVSYI
ncbi:hypothetical protein H5410_045920 [Solanum commersonii]|uniref:Uncharacterized protein n=1 Tax=Solanum commersonii TaxID=4109 RepID=A0A9J5XE61_SOLCO|nr:hypothetical protein H5410_045920 [Solanum commersonii]